MARDRGTTFELYSSNPERFRVSTLNAEVFCCIYLRS